MTKRTTKTILITGASTGIGQTTALHLAGLGYHVLAGVRRDEDAQSLQSHNIPMLEPIILDVTKHTDIELVFQRLEALEAGLFALINNAGVNYNSAFEFDDESAARDLMNLNFFGVANLSRRLLPALRRSTEVTQQTAKIINVSSVGGSFGLPWEVFYHASKFAIQGLSEGLRMELWKQNIRVSVVQPGGIRTEFMPKTARSIAQALERIPEEAKARYETGLQTLGQQIANAGKFGSKPVLVARAIERLLTPQNPRFRTFVGLDAKLLWAFHALLPYSWSHALFRRLFGA
jgi:NAD(P)-dependent dehydrogenase (short-subunit alcohol dehydrogenase family)